MNREEYDASLYLVHHGIKGQKWGVRRFQNADGTLTRKGMRRAMSDASKNNEWANSSYQPSSPKASFRAGLYAANPSRRNANKLDRANSKDELRYKAAKYVKSELDRKSQLEKRFGEGRAAADAYAREHGIDPTKNESRDPAYNRMVKDLKKIHKELKKFGSYEINSPDGVRIKAYGKTKIQNINLDDYYVGDGKLKKRRSEQKSKLLTADEYNERTNKRFDDDVKKGLIDENGYLTDKGKEHYKPQRGSDRVDTGYGKIQYDTEDEWFVEPSYKSGISKKKKYS